MEKSKALQTNKSYENSVPPKSFPTNVKQTYMVKKYTRKKDLQNQPQTIKKTAIGTYISIITLNVNRLNAPPKDTDCLNGCKNKTHIYAVYKKLTLDLKTRIA